jgi:hypothetical protein
MRGELAMSAARRRIAYRLLKLPGGFGLGLIGRFWGGRGFGGTTIPGLRQQQHARMDVISAMIDRARMTDSGISR